MRNKEEIRRYQLAQIELLNLIDSICKEKKLIYYLIGGTLLGAVRHRGFIPWDADIDIAMPRKDYELLREYFVGDNNDKYFYQHYATEKNHLSPHAILKIKDTHVIMKERITKYKPLNDGIYLDIFPLDNPPIEKEKQERQMKKCRRIRRIIDLKAGYVYKSTSNIKRILKKIVQVVLSPVSIYYLNQKLDKEMQKYNTDKSEYLVSMASHYSYWKQLMPKDVYGIPSLVSFEGYNYFAPSNTCEYLKRIYNNYMELPPENQRYSELDYIERVDFSKKKINIK